MSKCARKLGNEANRRDWPALSADGAFSLDEVREIRHLVDAGSLTCGEIHAMTVDHLADVKHNLRKLAKLIWRPPMTGGLCPA